MGALVHALRSKQKSLDGHPAPDLFPPRGIDLDNQNVQTTTHRRKSEAKGR